MTDLGDNNHMNERIKELAEQAGYRPLSPPTFADELNEIFMRKFAELIVQELLLKVTGAKIRNESYAELIERIKEDFGVE